MIRPFVALALVVALVGPAMAAADRYPRATMLGKIVAQVDPDSTLGGVAVFVSGGLDRQTAPQNGFAALVAEIVARTPVATAAGGAKIPLRVAVTNAGASLDVAVEPQNVRFYLEGRPEGLVSALPLLASALSAPDFSSATVRAAKDALRPRIGDAGQSPFAVVSSMLRNAYYLGSGAGFDPSGTPTGVVNAGIADLRAFWTASYRQGGIALSAAGHIDDTVANAAQALVAGMPDGPVTPVALKANLPTDPPARIVAHRDVSLPWIGVGFAAPNAGDKDFAAMLVVQAMLSSLGRQSSITTLPASLRPIDAVYQYNVRPANFIVYANGDSFSTTSGVRRIFSVAQALATAPLESEVLDQYKSLAAGQFVTDYVSLEDRTALLGSFARQGLDPDYANEALAAIDAVTADDIQRVAKNYLAKYTVALILPRTPLLPFGR